MKKFLALLLTLALLLSGCGIELPTWEETQAETQAASLGDLTVHFIDVGQADCALIEYQGEFLLIDGGNREDGQLVVSYLEQQGVQELEAVICTHAHEDHVGGLPSVLAVYPTAAVYAPTKTYSSKIFDKFLYYTDQQGLEVTIPVPGDEISLGEVTGTFLGPVQSYADTNNTSLVLRLEFGNTSFLFTGDMETDAESDMLNYWGDENSLFACDVLKVGHHGSNTSSGYRLLNAVDADYGVISVGAGNSYGHPHAEPLERFAQADMTILRTDELGHILAHSDGNTVTFTWQNQSATPSQVEIGETITYIGNKNSQKFHSPDCKNLPKEENQVYFYSYSEAIAAGFTPCGACLG